MWDGTTEVSIYSCWSSCSALSSAPFTYRSARLSSYLPPCCLQLLSPLILFCHYTLSQRIGPTQICPWGLMVYSLYPMLSFALPLWTPERALLIEAGTPASSCSAAPADNWTRRSQITLFSSSPTPSLRSFLAPFRWHSVASCGPVPAVISFWIPC